MNLPSESHIDPPPARRWVVFMPMLVAIAGLLVVLASPGMGARPTTVDGLITGAIQPAKDVSSPR